MIMNNNRLHKIARLVLAKKTEKIDRSAFLYLEDPKDSQFAQCARCGMWDKPNEGCAILAEDVAVFAGSSCGFFLPGTPNSVERGAFTILSPEEVGLVRRPVRCENCISMSAGSVCGLYKALNEAMPDKFDLNEKISPRGCCNAQRPKEKNS